MASDAVLPLWGGELAIKPVEKIDWGLLAAARSRFVGWSDISTLLLPLIMQTRLATLHGADLMHELYELPTEFERWTAVAALLPGRTDGAATPGLTQDEAVRRASSEFDVPVLLDFDTGHRLPQMPLVNGALAKIRLNGSDGSMVQHLVS